MKKITNIQIALALIAIWFGAQHQFHYYNAIIVIVCVILMLSLEQYKINKEKSKQKEIEVWIVKDPDGTLFIYTDKPLKQDSGNWISSKGTLPMGIVSVNLGLKVFPNIKKENEEPTKAKIVLIK